MNLPSGQWFWQNHVAQAGAGAVRIDQWLLRNSHTTGPPEITFNYGQANDLPLVWR